jgi:transposase
VHPVEVRWTHKRSASTLLEVVCDMSPAFLCGVEQHWPEAVITVDWFHMVQLFARSVGEVRKLEGKEKSLPHHLRRAVLKRGHAARLTTNQWVAIAEMTSQGLDTMTVWKLREKLPWIRKAGTPWAALWRITHFLNFAWALVGDTPRLERVRRALATLTTHARRVVQRWTWTWTCTNARLEGFNAFFQAARTRARGYGHTDTFITMVDLIGSPAGSILKST